MFHCVDASISSWCAASRGLQTESEMRSSSWDPSSVSEETERDRRLAATANLSVPAGKLVVEPPMIREKWSQILQASATANAQLCLLYRPPFQRPTERSEARQIHRQCASARTHPECPRTGRDRRVDDVAPTTILSTARPKVDLPPLQLPMESEFCELPRLDNWAVQTHGNC